LLLYIISKYVSNGVIVKGYVTLRSVLCPLLACVDELSSLLGALGPKRLISINFAVLFLLERSDRTLECGESEGGVFIPGFHQGWQFLSSF
jgi:hypothetical protein